MKRILCAFLLLLSPTLFADCDDCDDVIYDNSDCDYEYGYIGRNENKRYYKIDSDSPYYVRDMPGNRVLVAPREWWWLRKEGRLYSIRENF